jgi:hypothetical protein
MVDGDLKLCHRLCIELINSANLTTALKVETIQVMAMIVPFDQGMCYLEDAARLVDNKRKEEPEKLLWLGLELTTRDQIWKIAKFQGVIKFHREVIFGDPYVAARDRDFKKSTVLTKKRRQFHDEATQQQIGDPVKPMVRVQEEIANIQVYGPNRYVVCARQTLFVEQS